MEQYSTTKVDPSGENLCTHVPTWKIVMSQLGKEMERDVTFQYMLEGNIIKKDQQWNQEEKNIWFISCEIFLFCVIASCVTI